MANNFTAKDTFRSGLQKARMMLSAEVIKILESRPIIVEVEPTIIFQGRVVLHLALCPKKFKTFQKMNKFSVYRLPKRIR